MTCGNPDCLYLHDVGSQEDSFTKDEIISAYTRSRVPQMASSVSQRRSGTVLPPPADDFSYSAVVAAKHPIKNGITNTANQSRLSPPNSSSGRSTLPPAASWGHRDMNTRTALTGVASSQSLTKSKVDPQSNSISSSSIVSNTKLPSSWNDDTSTVPKTMEGRDSLSKTLKPYKPGIAKETQALTSLESSLDIDFSTIPSAWNDDDVVSDDMSKGSEEKHVVNDNEKLICSVSSMPIESGHLASKPSTSPKKDVAVKSNRQSPPNCISSQVVAKSEVKDGDGDHQVTNMASKTPTLVALKDQSNQVAIDTAIENIRSEDTDIDRLSLGVSSVTLSRKDGAQSMEEKQQLDAILNASVVVPLSHNLMLADNKDSTCQPSPDKHHDWCSDLPSSVTPLLNGIENSAVATDKSHVRVLDATAQASSSPYVHFPNTSSISLWNGKESSHASTSSTMIQPGLSSSFDSTSTMLNGHPEGLETIYAPGKVPEHLRVKNHQPGAVGAVRIDNIGSFDKAVSVNKDESSIISDILSLEFDPWDESYSTANNFAKMLSASEKNNVLFDAPSWNTKTSSTESRFSFARQDNQGSYSSMRNYRSEQNFSSSSQNSHGNIHQSGIAFQPPEEGFSKINSLTMLDMLATGTSKPKVSAPPGFSAPARVPPGFSSGFSSQEGLNPPPGFSSHNGPSPPPGFSSQGGSNQLQTSNDPRLQLLMQQNVPSHQNLGFADHAQDVFNPMNDYLASRLIPQNHSSLSSYAQMSLQQPRISHLTNGHWDGWGDLRQGNNAPMPEMSRMLYPTEANNFHMLGSNDLYNRAFGL
uniref:RNA binding (RRM/RBD/RNP motifs) family protein n=1 Tax=Leersia perrieri TaxID=77586 RepID=A0A0D9XN31_9ORYZ